MKKSHKQLDPVGYTRKAARHKVWRQENPFRVRVIERNSYLRNTYGITQNEFDRRVSLQGGLCIVCQKKRTLVVDHDHTSGKMRGLLCDLCNKGLGQFGEDVERMNRAIVYLEKWRDIHAAQSSKELEAVRL